jgi:hypothetical protein
MFFDPSLPALHNFENKKFTNLWTKQEFELSVKAKISVASHGVTLLLQR